MDFKEDQLAIEAHVRMRCGWRDMDEISEEEYMTYAYEYTDAHPCDSDLVINKREVILYNRIYGEFLALRTFPGIPFLWEVANRFPRKWLHSPLLYGNYWWGGWGSNPRPTDYESAALTG